MSMRSQFVLLHLSLIDGIGPCVVKKIRDRLPKNMTLADIYTLTASELITFFGLTEKAATAIRKGLEDTQILEQEVALIEKHAVSVVTLIDDAYPELLKAIHTPPTVLYYRGCLPVDEQESCAVVGARRANMYGIESTRSIVTELVEHGITIVSGGARGIDRVAHEQAIRGRGRTVAVLGSGLLRPYPMEHIPLFEDIVRSGGAVVSPFPLRMDALAGNFPARNRIIAGLSRACIVVQAAKRSGALITARYALDQGREVCAVPGPINSALSVGCHELIREGATLVTKAADMSDMIMVPSKPQAQSQVLNSIPVDSIQERIKYWCREPKSADDLADLAQLSLEELHAQLFQLQVEGSVQQDFMGLWQRI